jgi:hypothetical protein
MEQFAIGADFECAAARRDEGERFDALAELKNFGRQTDGLRRVVSDDAVFDRYFGFHFELLSEMKLSTRGSAVKTRAASEHVRAFGSVAGHRELIRRQNSGRCGSW